MSAHQARHGAWLMWWIVITRHSLVAPELHENHNVRG